MQPDADRNGTPLWAKPWLTIPEAMRLMRVGREKVLQMIADGRWLAVTEGKRMKISAQSIRDDVDAQTRADRDRVGLNNAA